MQTNTSLIMSDAASRRQRAGALFGQGVLFLITSLSTFAVFFIFFFILKDAIPFFKLEGFKEFFTSTRWYPSGSPAEFGALPIFMGRDSAGRPMIAIVDDSAAAAQVRAALLLANNSAATTTLNGSQSVGSAMASRPSC